MKMLLLGTLRGNPILYYGEELGLTQVDVPFELLQDPEAIANWPLTLSRDGARTPMPWKHDAAGLGFSSVQPWLPLGGDHGTLAVDVQEADAGSLLHWTRTVLALRRDEAALRLGAFEVIHADDALLVFARTYHNDRVVCAFNLSAEPQLWADAADLSPPCSRSA